MMKKKGLTKVLCTLLVCIQLIFAIGVVAYAGDGEYYAIAPQSVHVTPDEGN